MYKAKNNITVKNKMLSIFILSAISCSALTSLAIENNAILLASNSESSATENLLSDSNITLSIKKEFLKDDKIKTLNISVSTVNGKVTLTGAVPDKNSEERVISIAKRMEGVKEISYKLRIDKASYTKNLISDSNTTATIKLKLLDDEYLNGLDIHVSTVNEEVTLEGRVPNKNLGKRAESIAKNTNGVRKVTSKLHVE